MAEKGRLSKEQKEQNNETVKSIIEITNLLKEVVSNLNGEGCKNAYGSVINKLEKKNDRFGSKIPFRLTDEEKELIIKMREEKEKISEISGPETGEDESNAEISEPEDVKHEEKKTSQKKVRK